MATLEHAIEIAATAHAGQLDKAGEPYILHPIRVMLRMSSLEERITAILHDVVEDSTWTIEDLSSEAFSSDVIAALEALTKLPGESRTAAAKRAVQHPIARAVKLADNTENMDLSRIQAPTEKDYARQQEYEEVRSILVTGTME